VMPRLGDARGRGPTGPGHPPTCHPGAATVIGFLVAGLIIGALARLIKPGKQNLSILATLGLGLVGSLIGGLIAQFFGTGSIWELNVIGFVLAVIAAVLLIGTAESLTNRSRSA
jgi:uncharacterized membrane protein YeaQ/YmgE (transglycosylase-associated protein family)